MGDSIPDNIGVQLPSLVSDIAKENPPSLYFNISYQPTNSQLKTTLSLFLSKRT